jgi:preprotein translocase subunit SecE
VNRETKRMLQRSGSIDEAGNPVRAPRPAPGAAEKQERTPPAQYLREVQGELKKVAWPTRPEIKNYTIVVIVTLILMTALTFVYDWAFAKGVLYLLDR